MSVPFEFYDAPRTAAERAYAPPRSIGDRGRLCIKKGSGKTLPDPLCRCTRSVLLANRKTILVISAADSDAKCESHIPSVPSIRGSKSTAPTAKTRVRSTETAAETSPLLSAVKNAETNTLPPPLQKMRRH